MNSLTPELGGFLSRVSSALTDAFYDQSDGMRSLRFRVISPAYFNSLCDGIKPVTRAATREV